MHSVQNPIKPRCMRIFFLQIEKNKNKNKENWQKLAKIGKKRKKKGKKRKKIGKN